MRDSFAQRSAAPRPATDPSIGPRSIHDRPRVAVVDDSPEFLDLIVDVLGEYHDVSTHRVLRSVEDLAEGKPDIIVLDLHGTGSEGGLTGWEILSLARTEPSLTGVPVLVCSGDLSALREDRTRLVAYENVQVIAKPFDVGLFEEIVARMLRLAGVFRQPEIDDAPYPALEEQAARTFHEDGG